MSVILLALAQAAQVTAFVSRSEGEEAPPALTVAATQESAASVPGDLSGRPELKFRRRRAMPPALSSFVRDEVAARRCEAADKRLRVNLAVLVAEDGQLRRIHPQAIGCPTVEQYASGVMLSMARANLLPVGETRWFRTSLLFQWQ